MNPHPSDAAARLHAAALPDALRDKWSALLSTLSGYGSALMAYSGGVDSGLLAYAAFVALGQRMLAVTVSSPLEVPGQTQQAQAFAAKVGFAHTTLTLPVLDNADVVRNTPERCYFCKRSILLLLKGYGAEHGYSVVVEGQNVDDAADYRPGRRAVQETGTRSPLLECGLTKVDIRALAQALGLSIWNLPSSPCLATRIPYGQPLTAAALSRIAAAEAFLHELGAKVVRVRAHGDLARIEVEEGDLARVLAHHESVVARLRQLGFRYVALDLAGYRQGSMNEAVELDRLKGS
jgi:uncharacterized protein